MPVRTSFFQIVVVKVVSLDGADKFVGQIDARYSPLSSVDRATGTLNLR